MKKIKFLFFILILVSCSKEEIQVPSVKQVTQELEMISAYQEAFDALESGDPYFAAKKFLEVELLLPQSEWAPRSALMASYSYYLQNYYSEALVNLERFIKSYPNDKNISYAQYLIAICFYEQIEDEKRDAAPLFKAKKKFELIIENYPASEFALDAKFKLDLINNILAAKEIYIGRHYIKSQKWVAAINRFKLIINNYDQTIYVEEALHRLVEIHYKIGLIKESEKYANLLGYNYLSSEWYKKSYKVFNKNYVIENSNLIKKDKRKIIRVFKKLFD